jgi:hypothetical protein
MMENKVEVGRIVYDMVKDKGNMFLLSERDSFKSMVCDKISMDYAIKGKNVVYCLSILSVITHHQQKLLDNLEKKSIGYTINRRDIKLNEGGSVYFINKWYNDLPNKHVFIIEDCEWFLNNNNEREIILDKICNYGWERIFITGSIGGKDKNSFLEKMNRENEAKIYELIEKFKKRGMNFDIFKISREDYNNIIRWGKIRKLTENQSPIL